MNNNLTAGYCVIDQLPGVHHVNCKLRSMQCNNYWASTVIPNTMLEFEYSKLSNSPCPTEAHLIEIILSVISLSVDY